MTDRARIGVIGAGWWATSYHLPALAHHPHADIVGVADIDGNKAEKAARKHGVPAWFTDHRALLDLGVDGVVVATPHDTHFPLSRDALDAGADVLVEKPMVLKADHARELVALARTRARRLHVGYPFLYTRHAQELRQLIEGGMLGNVLMATGLFATSVLPLYRGVSVSSLHATEDTLWAAKEDTYCDPGRGGGQLLSQVTHCASLLLYLTGLRPRTVFGEWNSYDTRVDVWDGIVFKAESGAVATIASTGTVAMHERRVEEYRLFGGGGHALLDTAAGRLRVESYDGQLLEPDPLGPDEIYPAHAPATRLVDSIVHDEPVLASGELGLLTVELLAAAQSSFETGRASTLELDEPLIGTTTTEKR